MGHYRTEQAEMVDCSATMLESIRTQRELLDTWAETDPRFLEVGCVLADLHEHVTAVQRLVLAEMDRLRSGFPDAQPRDLHSTAPGQGAGGKGRGALGRREQTPWHPADGPF